MTLKRRPLLIAGLVLLGAVGVVGAALVLKDFVRDAIVAPLSYTFAGARDVVERMPQTLLWILFVGLALFLALSAVLVSTQVARYRQRPAREHRGRVENWLRWIRLANDAGEYSLQYLTLRLRELTLDVLADRELLTRDELESRLRSRQIDLPPAIRPQLEALLAAGSAQAVVDHTLDEASGWGNGKRAAAGPGFDMLQIVQFLEDQVEVSRE